MDDNNFQNSLCITSMKQELSGPTEAHGPFIFIRKKMLSHFIFSSHFMPFPTFIERKQSSSGGGGGGGWSVSTKFVVLAAEPVGGRSRATKLPCQKYLGERDQLLDSV